MRSSCWRVACRRGVLVEVALIEGGVPAERGTPAEARMFAQGGTLGEPGMLVEDVRVEEG